MSCLWYLPSCTARCNRCFGQLAASGYRWLPSSCWWLFHITKIYVLQLFGGFNWAKRQWVWALIHWHRKQGSINAKICELYGEYYLRSGKSAESFDLKASELLDSIDEVDIDTSPWSQQNRVATTTSYLQDVERDSLSPNHSRETQSNINDVSALKCEGEVTLAEIYITLTNLENENSWTAEMWR